jgi:TRAP-type C4-dicarboxylate transport system permease small subunit
MLIMVADVTNRYLNSRSIAGAYEAVELLVVAMTFLGIAYAERTDVHVRSKLLTTALPAKAADRVRFTGRIATLLIVAALTYGTGRRAWSSFKAGEYRHGLVEMPIWPARAIVAFGAALLTLELTMKLIRQPSSMADSGVSPERL